MYGVTGIQITDVTTIITDLLRASHPDRSLKTNVSDSGNFQKVAVNYRFYRGY